MTSETTRIDPATIDLADDEPDDLDRYIATLSRTDPELPAWLDAQLARDAQEAAGNGHRPGELARQPALDPPAVADHD